jgi:hypothetical protein
MTGLRWLNSRLYSVPVGTKMAIGYFFHNSYMDMALKRPPERRTTDVV